MLTATDVSVDKIRTVAHRALVGWPNGRYREILLASSAGHR
jgi:hypothetical protein